MRRYIVIAGLIIVLCLCFWTLNSFIRAQEETITLENTFGNVTYSHKSHTNLATCQDCHHTGMDTPKCTTCHTKDSKVNAMNAFHKKCIDCHKEKAAGPTACTDCHKK